MESSVAPLKCQDISSNPDVYFTTITYPTIKTGKEECKIQNENVEVKWDFNNVPAVGDFMCVFVDGRLYKKLTRETENDEPAREIKDIRPSSNVGVNAIRLRTHFTF
jgi:hypothetical protein